MIVKHQQSTLLQIGAAAAEVMRQLSENNQQRPLTLGNLEHIQKFQWFLDSDAVKLLNDCVVEAVSSVSSKGAKILAAVHAKDTSALKRQTQNTAAKSSVSTESVMKYCG